MFRNIEDFVLEEIVDVVLDKYEGKIELFYDFEFFIKFIVYVCCEILCVVFFLGFERSYEEVYG